MRILFVSPGGLYSNNNPFERGGTQSQIYGISKEMIRRGHEVYITGRFDDFKGREYKTIDGIQFVNIGTPHLRDEQIHQIGSSLLYSKAVAKKIKQINPDVISLNERFSAYFPSKLNIPKTLTTHNPDAMAFYKEFATESNIFNHVFFDVKKRVEESVMSRSDVIIALTRSISNYLQKNDFENISIIQNGVDVEKYANKGDEDFILFAGRLNKVKGIHYLIQAFSELSKDWGTDLLIIGSGPYESELKKLVTLKNIENRVHFIPIVGKDKLREYLSKCSVFVLPSLFETFGIVVIEAMASGKPVIASNIPGPKDIITHGYDGFLFERGNVQELKKYCELLFENEVLRKNVGMNAKKTIEDKYTFKEVVDEYINIFNRLLDGKK